MDILVTQPWTVSLSETNGFPLGRTGIEVRIANPACYLAQKLLVLPERKPDKQAKDALYIHDTLLILRDALDDLASLWKEIAAGLHANTRRLVEQRRTAFFDSVTDPVRGAALIAASTSRPEPPSPDRLAATCRFGLAGIFG